VIEAAVTRLTCVATTRPALQGALAVGFGSAEVAAPGSVPSAHTVALYDASGFSYRRVEVRALLVRSHLRVWPVQLSSLPLCVHACLRETRVDSRSSYACVHWLICSSLCSHATVHLARSRQRFLLAHGVCDAPRAGGAAVRSRRHGPAAHGGRQAAAGRTRRVR
jgi:hypothetical protein